MTIQLLSATIEIILHHIILFYFMIIFFSSILLKLKPLITKHNNLWTRQKEGEFNWINKIILGGISDFAKHWNCYEVHNIQNIQNNSKNCILVGYHSRCTLDLIYLISYIKPSIVTHNMLFKIPVINSILLSLNFISSKDSSSDDSDKAFVDAVAHGNKPLLLIPGGFWELTKPFTKRKVIEWNKVPGFIRLIVTEKELLGRKTKVIPFHTKNGDDCYLSAVWWRDWSGQTARQLYKLLKQGHVWVFPFLTVLLLLSLGFVFCPLTTKLDTFFGEALSLREEETEEQFSLRVLAATQNLMDSVEDLPERRRSNYNNYMTMFLLVATLGTLTLLQNFFIIVTTNIILVFVGFPIVLIVSEVSKLFILRRKVN